MARPALGHTHVLVADILHAPLFQDAVHLLARQVEIGPVAGQQIGVGRRVERGFLQRQKTVRKGPAVAPAVPVASAVFANLARQADVVGQHAAVGLGTLHPSVSVFHYPSAVLFIAGNQEGVSHQRCDGQVGRGVALTPAVEQGLPHQTGFSRVGQVLHTSDAGQVEKGQIVHFHAAAQGVVTLFVALG